MTVSNSKSGSEAASPGTSEDLEKHKASCFEQLLLETNIFVGIDAYLGMPFFPILISNF